MRSVCFGDNISQKIRLQFTSTSAFTQLLETVPQYQYLLVSNSFFVFQFVFVFYIRVLPEWRKHLIISS